MKKLINNPADVVEEMVQGLVACDHRLRRIEGHTVIVRANAEEVRAKQVAIISGGGSGHEPAHAGYVGRGMLSAAVAGQVFTSPSPEAISAAIRAVAGPPGVLLVVKNYTGDRLNFGLAAELARAQGVPVEVVIVADDVALAASTEHAGRRGLAGTIFVHKVAGAAAEAGLSLAEVSAEARAAASAVRTMGVALAACTVPATGKPGFTLDENEVELGLGIHGEPGVRRATLEPADAIVDRLLDAILADAPSKSGERAALLVNNLGATPTMEMAIVARHALAMLEERGVIVERIYCGTFLSALEMAGVSLTVCSLDDQRLARLDAPTEAAAWPNAAAQRRPPRGEERNQVRAEAERSNEAERLDESAQSEHVSAAIIRAIHSAAQALEAEQPKLDALDQAVGDGDLGTSLAHAAQALVKLANESAERWRQTPSQTILREIGATTQNVMGGSSGAFYGVFFLRAAEKLGTPPDDPGSWASALEAGCAAIAELGDAKRGDRTMLDALIPAADALSAAIGTGYSPADAARRAANAAATGATATASMKPKRGRSSYLGERALGHPDPGASAVGCWLAAIARALAGSP